jgi:predicted NUDIX family NTP pyrophosphohydrolase
VRRSAGLLVWRRRDSPEVLLVHPGGPLHAKRDVWGIPKGMPEGDEDLLVTAYREFEEELGIAPPTGSPVPIGEIVQKGGKVVTAWAIEGEVDVSALAPGLFEMEWPPRSGRLQRFPEIDRAEWFAVDVARAKMLPAQLPFLDRVEELS